METQETATAVATKPKRGSVARSATSEDFKTLTFSFGPKDQPLAVRTVEVDELAATHPYALAYGYRQILQDSYALGAGTSAEFAMAAFDKRLATLQSGEIRTRGEGEPKEDATDILVEAWLDAAAKQGQTLNPIKVKAAIEASDKSRRAAIRQQLQAEIYAVKARRAASKPATSAVDILAGDLA